MKKEVFWGEVTFENAAGEISLGGIEKFWYCLEGTDPGWYYLYKADKVAFIWISVFSSNHHDFKPDLFL